MQTGERAPESETLVETEAPEPVIKESVKDTTRRAYEQIEKELNTPDGNEENIEAQTPEKPRDQATGKFEKVSKSKRREVVVPDKGKSEQQVQAEPDYPPERLTLEEKEAYNKVPAPLKAAFKRMVKDHEAKLFQTTREVAAEREEVRGLKEAVYPFAKDWADRGFTLQQGIVSLARAQEKLTNESTKRQAAKQLLADIGVHPSELLEEAQTSQNGNYPDIARHPVINSLTEKVNYYENERQQRDAYARQQQQQAEQQVVDSIVQEVGTLREEKDHSGRYLYPMLHDPATLQRITPLLTELRRAIPDASWSDLAKEAYRVVLRQNGTSTNGPVTSPPANIQTQPNRARPSAISVRGRGGASPDPQAVSREAYKGLSIKDTARLAWDTLAQED